jgi:hypothetical protein
MIFTTTPSVEGKTITQYFGIVTGEAILGANLFKDLFAGIRDMVGGRSAAYERELQNARDIALAEMSERAGRTEPTPSSASIWITRCSDRATACSWFRFQGLPSSSAEASGMRRSRTRRTPRRRNRRSIFDGSWIGSPPKSIAKRSDFGGPPSSHPSEIERRPVNGFFGSGIQLRIAFN